MSFAKITSTFSAAALLTLCFAASSSAQAMVPQPGAFVPTECGAQLIVAQPQSANIVAEDQAAPRVKQVCFGLVAGETNQSDVPSIAFRMNDSTQQIFAVTQTSTLLMALASGETKTLFFLSSNEGEQTTMKVLRDREGKVLNVNGTLGQVPYSVSGFQPVVVMQ